jgi:hypothetical protein
MNGRDPVLRDRVGLCRSCRASRALRSARGSEFWLCERSRSDPAHFPKYPRLPVLACAGFAPAESVEPQASIEPADPAGR